MKTASKIAASLPVAAIASQIAVMSGSVSVVAPQSTIARFIFGELKGGEHKHNFSMGVVSSAIEQALKGNQRDIPEAMKLCTGKSVKARAFLAGFHVIADSVKPVAYTGKLADKANDSVREVIASTARHLACEFELAYLATIENAKMEAAFNRKAKAKTAPAVDAVESESAAPVAASVAPSVEMDVADVVDAAINAIRAGMLSAPELEMLRIALATVDAPALAIAA